MSFPATSRPRRRHRPPERASELVALPLYGRIAAGTPIEALRGHSEHVEVPATMVTGGEHYALSVAGDSMVDAGIHDGDTVIIQRCDNAENGSIVVALVDEAEVTLKRLRRKGASVALEPANAAYETRIFGPDRVRVQGRLVALMRRIKPARLLAVCCRRRCRLKSQQVDLSELVMDAANSILSMIGNTPLLELTKMDSGPCRLFVKMENQNPAGSIKDRIGLSIIEAAERDGRLKPGGTIVEATAGNTGLGLALVAAQKGYRLVLVIPDKMSAEKIRHLRRPWRRGPFDPLGRAERPSGILSGHGRQDRRRDARRLLGQPIRQPGQSGGA